jgi:hypothetical protein
VRRTLGALGRLIRRLVGAALAVGLIALAAAVILYAIGADAHRSLREREKANQQQAEKFLDLARTYTQRSYQLMAVDQAATDDPGRDDCLDRVMLVASAMRPDVWDGRVPEKARFGIASQMPRALDMFEQAGVTTFSIYQEQLVREGALERYRKLHALRPHRPGRRLPWWKSAGRNVYERVHGSDAQPLERDSRRFANPYERERDTLRRASRRTESARRDLAVAQALELDASLRDMDHLPAICESPGSREQAAEDARAMLEASRKTMAFSIWR